MALGMTAYGAQGVTSSEMMKTLHWNEDNSNNIHEQLSNCMKIGKIEKSESGNIKIANKLFLERKYQLVESFVKGMDKFYCGGVEKVKYNY